jgi:hypothetical protein
LQRVHQRWSVDLGEHVFAILDDVVGADSQDGTVERSVMNGAHRDPVRHDGFTTISILLDVGGIEKACVSKPAQGALACIRR